MLLVGEGIYLLDEGLEAKTMARRVYLVLGERAALIEAGPTNRADAIRPERLSELGVRADDVSHILLSHVHLDHSGAAGYLSRLFPRAHVVVHHAGARHMVEPSKLLEATRAVYGRDAEELYGPVIPVQADRVLAAAGGELVDLGGGRSLRVIDAPGHAPHHLAFYDERSRGLFAGEALGIYNAELDLLEPAGAPPLFDLVAAVGSARLLAELSPKNIYHCHTGVQQWAEGGAERYVNVVLAWAERVRQAIRQDPNPARVSLLMHAYAAHERGTAATARGLKADASLPVSIQLHVDGYMGFFERSGLDTDLSLLKRDGRERLLLPRSRAAQP